MAKKKARYVCQECGHVTSKWSGRCPECGSWGSLVEEPYGDRDERSFSAWVEHQSAPCRITEVSHEEQDRFETGFSEFDALCGGGLVRGSVSLLSGEPGAGKSTLLMQVSRSAAALGKVLYVSAEESAKQVALRAKRLEAVHENIFVITESNLERIFAAVDELKPVFCVFDSIQTLFLPQIESAPGSVSQTRECTARITKLCKSKGITSFLVGHITKEGSVAGPKVLEHIVDAVFQFEGDRGHSLRILKALKNRFGKAGEVAVFEMTEKGLKEVKNPSEFFLSERPLGKPGSAVFAAVEGSRPVLLEIQALVTRAVFTTPQRRATGIDPNRLSMIVAVLEKEMGIPLRNFDIFVNVVGGVKVSETAADLPVAVAIASSYFGKPVRQELALFGEVGLSGELRSVRFPELREREAQKMGLRTLQNFKKGIKSLLEAVKASLGEDRYGGVNSKVRKP